MISAATPLSPLPLSPGEEADLAMRQGIQRLASGTPEDLTASLALFDRAIALRRSDASRLEGWNLYALAGAWMNRADALTRIGGPEPLAQAILSHREALNLLQHLPPQAHPLFLRRHAIAWLNQGVTFHALGTPDDTRRSALESFDRAIALLETTHAPVPDRPQLLASAWMNRANTLLADTSPPRSAALHSARTALQWIQDCSRHCPTAAGIEIRSRQALCQIISHFLVEPSTTADAAASLRNEATHAVREGLRLGRHWNLNEGLGYPSLHPIVINLFQFGCRLFEEGSPEDLADFVLESLDPVRSPGAPVKDQPMHEAATLALWQRYRTSQRQCLRSLGTPLFRKEVDALIPLCEAEARLLSLREAAAMLPPPD